MMPTVSSNHTDCQKCENLKIQEGNTTAILKIKSAIFLKLCGRFDELLTFHGDAN